MPTNAATTSGKREMVLREKELPQFNSERETERKRERTREREEDRSVGLLALTHSGEDRNKSALLLPRSN